MRLAASLDIRVSTVGCSAASRRVHPSRFPRGQERVVLVVGDGDAAEHRRRRVVEGPGDGDTHVAGGMTPRRAMSSRLIRSVASSASSVAMTVAFAAALELLSPDAIGTSLSVRTVPPETAGTPTICGPPWASMTYSTQRSMSRVSASGAPSTSPVTPSVSVESVTVAVVYSSIANAAPRPVASAWRTVPLRAKRVPAIDVYSHTTYLRTAIGSDLSCRNSRCGSV